MIMDKSLIDKLKEVIEQYHKETGERVESVSFVWARGVTSSIDRLIKQKSLSISNDIPKLKGEGNEF